MKNRSGEKIKLASIDELLGVVNEESAMEIEISKIHPFIRKVDAGTVLLRREKAKKTMSKKFKKRTS